MDEWRFIAERKIREAMEEGAFDDLSGTGEPLDLSEDPFEDPSLRMAHRLLRNNGFAPEWIMESREIDAEARLLRSRPAMSPEEFRRRVEVLNKRILAFNLKAPAVGLQKLPLKLEP
jgi:DnaJ-like protein